MLWFLRTTPAVSTTSTKTQVQILAPANQRVIIEYLAVHFQGVVTTDAPIQCELLIQTTAGTASALTINKHNPADDETLQTSAQETFTAEPTASTIKRRWFVHPQSSRVFIAQGEWAIPVPGGTRMAFRTVTPGVSVSTIVEMGLRE